MSRSNAVGNIRTAKNITEKVWSAFSGMRRTKFSQLSESQKDTFFLMYPHLKQREAGIDRVANIGAAAMSFFGICYLGVEISGVFGLIATGLLFNMISLALLLTGFVIYIATTMAREFAFTWPCEALLNEGGLYLVFEQVEAMHAETIELRASLQDLRSFFEISKVGARGYNETIAESALLNIRYALEFLNEESQSNIEKELLHFRDPADLQTQLDAAISSGRLRQTGEFQRPVVPLDAEKAQQLHQEVVNEFSKIRSNIKILQTLKLSMRKDGSPEGNKPHMQRYDRSSLKVFAMACKEAAKSKPSYKSAYQTVQEMYEHTSGETKVRLPRENRLLSPGCPIDLRTVEFMVENEKLGLDDFLSSKLRRHDHAKSQSPINIITGFLSALGACFYPPISLPLKPKPPTKRHNSE